MALAAYPASRFMFRLSSRLNAFGPSRLGLRLQEDGGDGVVNHIDERSIAITLPTPAWLSRADGLLPMAASLATLDEISSFGMVAWDERLRGGVTVTLAGERTSSARVEPEEPLTYLSHLIKGGQTLSWIHMEVRNASGEVLLTGRHLKFLPAGLPPFWATLAHPMLRPLMYRIMEMHVSRQPDAPAMPLPAAGTPLMDVLAMRASDDASAAPLADPLLPDAASPLLFAAELSRQHGNPGVNLHGGCASMLCEEAASSSFCAARGVEAAPPVQRMRVSLPGAIDVRTPTTVEVAAVASAAEARAHAVLRAPGKQVAAVEAEVWW